MNSTWEVPPGAWALRPARCSSRARFLADPICTTRSTGWKSTPRSRELVHTTQRSSPAFTPASIASRAERSMALWCRSRAPSISGQAKRRHWCQRSAWLRVLVNRSVETAGSRAATSSSYMRSPRWPAHGKPSIRSGSRLRMLMPRRIRALINRGSAASAPTAARAASARLPMVALIAQVRRQGRSARSQLRQSSAWLPRLLPSSSCHSSSTTASSRPKSSGARALLSSTASDSGVVIRIWGGLRS